MAYLKFNKDELVNLEYSLKREVLATNRAGGYMSSTIIGCNTRIVPRITEIALSKNSMGRIMCCCRTWTRRSSSMDVSLIWVSISIRVMYEPRGHKYIVDFEYEPVFTLTYRVGGVQLKEEIILAHNVPSGPDPLYFAGCPFRYRR